MPERGDLPLFYALQGERVSARAINKGRLIRIRGFSPPRQGIVCKQPLLLSLSAALPRHCIDRYRYHYGFRMQFLAMTRFREFREIRDERDKRDVADRETKETKGMSRTEECYVQ